MRLRDLFSIPGYKATIWRSKGGGPIRRGTNRHQLTKAQKKRARRNRTRAALLANGRLVARRTAKRGRRMQRALGKVWSEGAMPEVFC